MQAETNIINRRASINVRNLVQKYSLPLIFLAICIIISLLTPTFLLPENLRNVMIQIAINALIGVGMTYVILIGGIDISVGSVVGLAGIVVTAIIKTIPDPSTLLCVFVSIGISIAVGILCGGINGIAVIHFRIPPFIATLGMYSIARGLAFVYTQSRPIFELPESFSWIGQGYIGKFPVIVIIMIIVLTVAHIVLDKTTFGRYVYAVGSNSTVAELSGINVKKITMIVYILCGILSAFAGVCLASKLAVGQPSAGTSYELTAIAAVVMGGTSMSGGKGNMVNTVFGLLTIGAINNGLSLLQVSSYWQGIAMGMIILIFVALEQLSGK